MSVRAVAVVAGVAFGFLISWAGLTDPDQIQAMLLFEDWYLYPMFVSAVAVGFVGLRALRGSGFRALVTRDLVAWTTAPPRQRHVVGSVLFGTGWAVADACPGPVAAQLGYASLWSLCTAAGVVVGIVLYLRRVEAKAARVTPPAETAPTAA